MRLARTAMEPEKISRLIEVLDDNHGYALYRSVSALKEALSAHADDGVAVRFEVLLAGQTLARDITHAEFAQAQREWFKTLVKGGYAVPHWPAEWPAPEDEVL